MTAVVNNTRINLDQSSSILMAGNSKGNVNKELNFSSVNT